MSDTAAATETAENKKIKVGFFTDEKGALSMRRLLAFLLCITSIALAVLCIINKLDWKICLVVIGLPLAASLLFMFFTTWADVSKVAESIKK